MNREERERQRIIAVLEKSDSEDDLPDNDDEVEEEDHVSVHSEPSDTEQECSDHSLDTTYIQKNNRNAIYNKPCAVYIIHRINNNKPSEKRRFFLKNLGLALVSEHLKIRQNVNRLPREMRKRIREFVAESSEEPPAKIPNARKRCQVCPAKKDRKTKHTCQACHKFICPEHIISFCSDCINNEDSN